MSAPTESGDYWLRLPYGNLLDGRQVYQFPEIVHVVMDYSHRNKLVPMVLGRHWKEPMAKMPVKAAWSERLEPPADWI